ncbi:hypothetical protein FPV67DRAFT_1109765 [Lyophyllum atratum]|nr:hypothetical protein FPV67DRAFT_1109765 [Lyophyllum atratum]
MHQPRLVILTTVLSAPIKAENLLDAGSFKFEFVTGGLGAAVSASLDRLYAYIHSWMPNSSSILRRLNCTLGLVDLILATWLLFVIAGDGVSSVHLARLSIFVYLHRSH